MSKTTKKKKKKKKQAMSARDVLSVLFLVAAIIVALCAGYRLYSIMMEYKAGSDEYADIQAMAVKERDADEEEIQALEGVTFDNDEKHWESPLEVDFMQLKSINDDVVGWLYMEALPDISYPIVQGEDNDFYLHRTYKKEEVFAGAIFADCKNSPDFSDQNTIVYGHNMKDGSMFGTLKQYQAQETFDKSKYFWIITPDDAYKYEIFSVYVASVDGDTYTLIKGPGEETVQYGKLMDSHSIYGPSGHEFVKTDKIVTLSTCTGNSETRFVVQGVRVYPE